MEPSLQRRLVKEVRLSREHREAWLTEKSCTTKKTGHDARKCTDSDVRLSDAAYHSFSFLAKGCLLSDSRH